jgi:LysM repeat protein
MPLEDDSADLSRQSTVKKSGGFGSGLSSIDPKVWLVVGGIGIVVIYLLARGKGASGSSKSTGASAGTNQGNVDTATGFPIGSSADVAALRTYGALGGGGRFNMGSYPTARGGEGSTVHSVGLGGAYMAPYEPIDSAWVNGLAEPQFPVGPAGPPGPGNSGATGMNTAELLSASQALTTQSTVPIDSKSYSHTRVYRVKPGDNLAGIAAKFGVAGGYPTLYRLNQHTIGPNPDMLIPGTLIYLLSDRADLYHTADL